MRIQNETKAAACDRVVEFASTQQTADDLANQINKLVLRGRLLSRGGSACLCDRAAHVGVGLDVA